ncbi:MAG: hypothetical protein ABI151_02605 [Chitinophagaceae bacterium]
METPSEHVEYLFKNAGHYIENKAELLKLKIIDKSSDLVSSLVEKILLFVMILIFFFFFNVAVALLIGYWLGESFYGFFIVAGFYGIVGLIIHFSREKLIRTPITNSLIEKFLK